MYAAMEPSEKPEAEARAELTVLPFSNLCLILELALPAISGNDSSNQCLSIVVMFQTKLVDGVKRYLLCSRRAALASVASAALLFALPFIAFVPYAQSVFFHSLELNLYWICFFVVLAVDARKRNFGRCLVYGGTIAVLYIAVMMCMVFGPVLADYSQRGQFDSASWKAAAWKTAVGRHSHARLRMVDDLLHRYNLVGMSRAKIVDLLGEPSSNESKQTSSEYIYYLGPERGFISIDDEWLDIKFQGDLVVSALDRTD
jgi:hypothetical protein